MQNKIEFEIKKVCIQKGKYEYVCRRTPHNMSNQRMHWGLKHKWNQAWKQAVYDELRIMPRGNIEIPFREATVTIVLKTTKPMDQDGAYNSVKPILDALKIDNAGIILDDSPDYITLNVNSVKVEHQNEEGVVVQIQEGKIIFK